MEECLGFVCYGNAIRPRGVGANDVRIVRNVCPAFAFRGAE